MLRIFSLVFLILVSPAFSQTNFGDFNQLFDFSGRPFPTPYTGNSETPGFLRELVSQSEAGRRNPNALLSLSLGERQNDPCAIEGRFWNPRTNNFTPTTDPHVHCHRNQNRNRASSPPREVRVGGPQVFITGLSVCLNKDRTKVKGIAIRTLPGACILGQDPIMGPPRHMLSQVSDGYGPVTADPDSLQPYRCNDPSISRTHFELPNCAGSNSGVPDVDWEPFVNCETGQAAVSALAEFSSPNAIGRRNVVALALICRRLERFTGLRLQSGSTPTNPLDLSTK